MMNDTNRNADNPQPGPGAAPGLEAELERARAELERARLELRRIHASRLWRWSRPVFGLADFLAARCRLGAARLAHRAVALANRRALSRMQEPAWTPQRRLAVRPEIGAAASPLRPLISVVVPVFDTAPEHLLALLDSLERQTLGGFEAVLANDGSSRPDTLEALRQAGLRPWTRIVDQPNRGPAAARNAGVLFARSDSVMLIDADDLLCPTALEKLFWLQRSAPEADFVYPGIRHFGEFELDRLDEFDAARLRIENYLACAALMPRAFYLALGGMDEALRNRCEDYDFWLEAAGRGARGRLLPETVFLYRHGEPPERLQRLWERRETEAAAVRRRHGAWARLRGRQRPRPPLPVSPAAGAPHATERAKSVPFALAPGAHAAAAAPRVLCLAPGPPGAAAREALRALAAAQARATWVADRAAGDLERHPALRPPIDEAFSLAHLNLSPATAEEFLMWIVQTRKPRAILDLISIALSQNRSAITALNRIGGQPIISSLHVSEIAQLFPEIQRRE